MLEGMSQRRSATEEQYRRTVAAYVAAGGEESVQRVINGLYIVTRKLDQWYDRQLADLELTHGEWSVLATLAKAGESMTAGNLAEATNVAPSSMTHRLDKMTERGLVSREPDPENRTRMRVSLTRDGWGLFERAVREANVVEADTLAGLSEQEREALGAALENVIAHLDEIT